MRDQGGPTVPVAPALRVEGSPPGGRRAAGALAADVPEPLRHRGGFATLRPDPGLFARLGGETGVRRLVDELYDRIGADPLLRHVFPHAALPVARNAPTRFFVEWFGGEPAFSRALEPGLSRLHQHLFVSPLGAAAWLRCMVEALAACAVAPAPVMRSLAPIAQALINRPDTEPAALTRHCDLAQDEGTLRLERALEDLARGRTDAVTRALADDPLLAVGRGKHGQSLLWLAVYKNRPELAGVLLDLGADPSAPACDPPRGEIAGDRVRPGTIVSVTPLALAEKQGPALAPLLLEHGAVDDIFTAAWLGDREQVAAIVARHPELVGAVDPAEDFQRVTPLAHALAGGATGVVSFLLERGAQVRAHSGKLLDIAILLNRPDLVRVLLEHGADAREAASLGPLDLPARPIADLLIAHGARVPTGLLPRACRADVGRNALHRVRVLLGYGADVNGRSREGCTALHYAARSGDLPLIRLLLAGGADAGAVDHAGLTPLLHLAKSRAQPDHRAVLETLADHGADLNARNAAGETLLHFYARRGEAHLVRWLLEHGADPDLVNHRGATAAAVTGDAAVAHVLGERTGQL
jgi:ankyrin repeat protein/truncated hemoglobin YjbI